MDGGTQHPEPHQHENPTTTMAPQLATEIVYIRRSCN
jgi:hypothetical protein